MARREGPSDETGRWVTPGGHIARTSVGLREILFLELEKLRDGTIDHRRAMATAVLAQAIIKTVRMEVEFANKIPQMEGVGALPSPPAVNLGSD